MSLVAAAVVPSAPLLVPELAGGSAPVDAVLRTRVLDAVAELLRGDEPVVVVGAAPVTGPCTGTWDWSGFGLRLRGGEGPALPLALAVGAWLLDGVAPDRERSFLGVGADEEPEACAALGRQVASSPVRLLVVGDGTARRTEKAPGHLDPRAEAYDAEAAAALADGDPGRLLGLPAGLGRELLASGRAAWQVLAGAAGTGPGRSALLHDDAPYGVGYLVASWSSR
ncbi:MAG: hypothetical protein JWM64_1417 [Frankiales bacterium]|nr:hypothetical protein [Frankiales bacterium]